MLRCCRSQYYPLLTLVLLLVAMSGCRGDIQAKKASHMQKGDAYVATQKYDEAIIEFKNAVQLDPNDAQAHYKLGLAHLKKGGLADLQKAFQAFRPGKTDSLPAALFIALLPVT